MKRKRTRSKGSKKVSVKFYRCTKTMRDGNGNICFRKKKEYQLVRFIETASKDLRGMIMKSEVWGAHVVQLGSWGDNFEFSEDRLIDVPLEVITSHSSLDAISGITRIRSGESDIVHKPESKTNKPKRVRRTRPSEKVKDMNGKPKRKRRTEDKKPKRTRRSEKLPSKPKRRRRE